MKEVEKILNEKKIVIENVNVPDELEIRLRNALKNKKISSRIRKNWKINVAAVIILALLIGYNFDTLAFYGKKLIGYDQVMNGTLQNLNELGKGQTIGKSYTFENGVIVTLDGIMVDDNRLLAFYTVKDPSGKRDIMDYALRIHHIKGFGQYNISSSQGNINEEKTEVNYISEFETPKFFEKELSFKFALTEDHKREMGEISFTLDRSKAMGYTLKKAINQSVQVDESKIRFKSILASPTSTSIKGYIQNSVELIKDQIKGERFRPKHLEIKLIANDKEVSHQGSSMSTDLKGMTFQFDYDVLPSNLEKLQINVVSFSSDHDVNHKVVLNKDRYNKPIELLGQKIDIKDVYESNDDTYITISTEKNTVLTRVNLIIDGETIELEKTISDDYIKTKDGTILHTRTLHFPGKGSKLELDIQRMTYKKVYNEIIDIELN